MELKKRNKNFSNFQLLPNKLNEIREKVHNIETFIIFLQTKKAYNSKNLQNNDFFVKKFYISGKTVSSFRK